METALAVYDGAIRGLEDGWNDRADRSALRRASAGKVVCLRALEREPEAQAVLDEVAGALPEWNRNTLGWIRHDLGRAYHLLGVERQAVAEYAEAVRISQAQQELDPHCAALLHLSELVAPTDPAQALALVDDAVALIDRFVEAERGRQAEQAGRRAADAAERGEPPEPEQPARPDPVKLARRAAAQASKIRLLIEPEPAPDEVLEQLLPAAYRAADEGTGILADLVRAADEDDPRRGGLIGALESAVGWAATVQGGMGDDAGAAARFTAFAELAEECGFPSHARTARGNALAMNPRGADGPDPAAAASAV
jgi:tetratricopeptide (TPR) repeat protein